MKFDRGKLLFTTLYLSCFYVRQICAYNLHRDIKCFPQMPNRVMEMGPVKLVETSNCY